MSRWEIPERVLLKEASSYSNRKNNNSIFRPQESSVSGEDRKAGITGLLAE